MSDVGLLAPVGLHQSDDDVDPFATLACAASSIAYVLPTPGQAPKKTLSLPRCLGALFLLIFWSNWSGLGRVSSIIKLILIVTAASSARFELQDVYPGLAQDAQLPGLNMLCNELAYCGFRQMPGPGHARHLVKGCCRADIRVQAAG